MRILTALTAILLTLICAVNIDTNRITEIYGSKSFYDVNGKLYHVRLSPKSEWQIPVKLSEMGKWLPLVAVKAEDGRFYGHIGIDVLSVMRAVLQNIARLETVSGASTITSQVIRLTYSENEGRKRTLSTKLYEFVRALRLEMILTKDEILEAYLNHAPFGGNIRGVQAASLIYFGKNAWQISPGEACMLIGMLKAPSLYRPDKNPQKALSRRNEIISLMERKKAFSHQTALRAKAEELPRKKYTLPSKAYHYTELVTSVNPNHNARYDTSLNLELQAKLEGILGQSLEDLPEDITYSAGIAENVTGNIVSWVGNARFSYAGNWVDCGKSLRSPGSTLKPFAYLCAVERGILTPSTMLYDTPYEFSGRAPRNFDLTYRGAVTARTALSMSLNAPAVRVLRLTGRDYVLTFLRETGYIHLTNNAEYYGDALILGGCEATLLDELEAYTALASGGIHRKLRLLSEDITTSERIASTGAAWIISDILRSDGHKNFAVKTGTSYGLRDAWACAYTPEYTVCIWAGKEDGSSWPGLVGAEISLPVAVKILRAITSTSSWYERPHEVTVRKVCTLSGNPPTALCPSVRNDYAIPSTRTTPCEFHRTPSAKAPSTNAVTQSRLNITSPIPGAFYIASPLDTERKIPLSAEGTRGKISWYIDGKYAGTSEAGRTIYRNISDGEHKVSITDSNGRTTSTTVNIYTPASKAGVKLF